MNIPNPRPNSKRKNPPARPAPRSREAVLVVSHGDNYIEIFAERHIDVRIERAPYTGTVAGELVAEEYLDHVLPRRYRDIHWPSKLRNAAKLSPLWPSDLIARDDELAMLHALDRFTPAKEGGRVWTL